MPPEDKAYLWDMLSAVEDILSFVKNIPEHEFIRDKKTRFAVERQLLVLGEAAKGVSEETRSTYQEIPWKRLVKLRNIIAHEYGDILIERIWNISKRNMPELFVQLKSIKL